MERWRWLHPAVLAADKSGWKNKIAGGENGNISEQIAIINEEI